MLIYRFRITSADQEDFIREIEIQPTQTFLDFHDVITSCSDLDSCQNAVFFNTDKKYKPHSEISLKLQKKQLKKYDEELDEIVTVTATPHLMKDSQLKRFIEDPHQRMIYEYTGKDFLVFHIELFKIMKTDEIYDLPRCTKRVGELPKRVEVVVAGESAHEKEKVVEIPIIPPSLKPNIFEGLHEDEAELAEIENSLDDFLEIDGVNEGEAESPVVSLHEDEEFGTEEDDRMESLEDYEDLENLEMKHRNFDRNSDEF
jgi:hypothetical protein